MPGILTLGVLGRDMYLIDGHLTLGVLGRDMYLIDGQHRRQTFLLSGSEETFVDVRLHHFEDMAQGEEFVNL